jgi:hypothetical protein
MGGWYGNSDSWVLVRSPGKSCCIVEGVGYLGMKSIQSYFEMIRSWELCFYNEGEGMVVYLS